ncbi:DUF5674 family protein [Candidatus Margulisiibacteriota bacterium]
MKIIKDKISLSELKEMATEMFGNMVKAVVDINQGVMAVDAELHADEEAALLEKGSKQQDLWGINIYPEQSGDELIEFDSMINLRPAHNNKSRGVDDPTIQQQIRTIIAKLVIK